MCKRSILLPEILLASIVTAAVAGSSWTNEDPAQWTSEDVYQILNNSPWSKSATVTVARGSGYGESPAGGGNGGVWSEGAPGMPGGMGRSGGGWGGGGMGRRRGGYPGSEHGPTVTVQWQSALPVRLAQAKSSGGGTADAAAMKPLNEYVIAVIGMPKSGFEGRGSTSGSDTDSGDAALAEHLKVITVLSFGHERLNPSKVELNQGRDGRAVFHFEHSEPITPDDKNVEFRITGQRMEIREKFALKAMKYRDKLEL